MFQYHALSSCALTCALLSLDGASEKQSRAAGKHLNAPRRIFYFFLLFSCLYLLIFFILFSEARTRDAFETSMCWPLRCTGARAAVHRRLLGLYLCMYVCVYIYIHTCIHIIIIIIIISVININPPRCPPPCGPLPARPARGRGGGLAQAGVPGSRDSIDR